MKSKLIALAIIALACMGGGGVLASTASAANCTTITVYPYVYDGPTNSWYVANIDISGCTGTEAVRVAGGSGGWTIIRDDYYGVYHLPWEGAITTTGQFSSYNLRGPRFSVWGGGCGFPPFHISTWIGWQIKNSATHTWGGLHQSGIWSQMIC